MDSPSCHKVQLFGTSGDAAAAVGHIRFRQKHCNAHLHLTPHTLFHNIHLTQTPLFGTLNWGIAALVILQDMPFGQVSRWVPCEPEVEHLWTGKEVLWCQMSEIPWVSDAFVLLLGRTHERMLRAKACQWMVTSYFVTLG